MGTVPGMDRKPPATRSGPYLVVAAAVLALGAAAVVPPRLDLTVGGTIAAIGFLLLAVEWRSAAQRRTAADALLASVAVSPPELAWRVRELTAPRERRLLARSLRRIVDRLDAPRAMGAVPVSRAAVWPNRHAVVALADRLAATESPVHPAGIVLVRELIMDGLHSPLYDDNAARLRERLTALQRAMER
jgi:hypothetical protein